MTVGSIIVCGTLCAGSVVAALRVVPAVAPTITSVGSSPTTQRVIDNSYKSSLSVGRAAHQQFSLRVEAAGGVADKAVFVGSRLRPDGYFTSTNTIMELKPGNLNGIQQGLTQLQGYQGLAPQGANVELWLYNQSSNGTFNYWQYIQ